MGKREHIYKIIAENIRKERRRLGITQAELAERADVSLDTIKSVENGRRAMSLDTYLNIVHALESSPMAVVLVFGKLVMSNSVASDIPFRSEKFSVNCLMS